MPSDCLIFKSLVYNSFDLITYSGIGKKCWKMFFKCLQVRRDDDVDDAKKCIWCLLYVGCIGLKNGVSKILMKPRETLPTYVASSPWRIRVTNYRQNLKLWYGFMQANAIMDLEKTETIDWREGTDGLEVRYGCMTKWATTCDFQQCGILTSVDSDEPSSLLVGLDTPNDVKSVA